MSLARASRSWIAWAGGGLLALASTAVFLSQVSETRFFGDEAGWIRASYHTADLLLEGRFGPKELAEVGYSYGNLNPQLGKLLLGVPLVLYSDHFLDGARYTGTYYRWRAPASYESKVATGEAPPREILELGRTISAGYGVLCVLAVFAFVSTFFGVAAGLIAGALLLATPVFVEAATRSMTDIEYNLLLVASLPILARSLSPSSRRRELALAALLGLVAALASSVKISGLPLVGLAYALLLGVRGLRRRGSARRSLHSFALFLVVAVSCIYALNPFYWPDVREIRPAELRREVSAILFEGKRLELGVPLLEYAGARYDRRQLVETFPQLYNLLRPLEFPAHYLRWNSDQLAQASRQPWPGRRLEVIARRLLVDFTSSPLEWIFLLWGAAIGWLRIASGWRDGSLSPYLVPLGWFALNLAVVLLGVRVYGDRYFLPTVIAQRILIALGLLAGADWLWRRYGARLRRLATRSGAPDRSD